MSFRLLVMSNTANQAANLTTLQGVVGTSNGTAAIGWKQSGSTYFFDCAPKIETFYEVWKNVSTLTAAGMDVHIYGVDSATTIKAERDSRIAGFTGGEVDFGQTTPIAYLNEAITPEDWIVIDARNIAKEIPPVKAYNCTGHIANIMVVGAHGGISGTVANGWASGICFSRCHDLLRENLWVVGGKVQGGITDLGKPLSQDDLNYDTNNCHVMMDSVADWEGFGWWPGDSSNFEDVSDLYGYENYVAGNEYLQFTTSANLGGVLGTSQDVIRLQKQQTASNTIIIDYTGVGIHDGNINLPLTERRWFLMWEGLDHEVQAVCTSVDTVNKLATVVAEEEIPAGAVGWYADHMDWKMRNIRYRNCRAISPTGGAASVASGFTGYHGIRIIIENCYSTGFDDRAFGGEFCEDLHILGCVCQDGTVNDEVQFSFFSRNCSAKWNRVTRVKFDLNGYPGINIEAKGFHTNTNEIYQGTTVPGSNPSTLTNWYQNCEQGGAVLSPTFVTVTDANLENATVPGFESP